MSLFGDLISGIFGKSESEVKPCSNCPSDCGIYPDACGECREYKEKLINALYDVAHIDEYYDRYEVVAETSAAVGSTACPYCGGPNPANAAVCEYCGSQLREGSAKIQVASAGDIPDPIQKAQDIIFARQEIVDKYDGGEGILETLSELVKSSAFGDRMSTDEIKATASAYGVSPADYLQGLDNGIYLTASAKSKKDKADAAAAAAAVAGGAATVGTYAVTHGAPHRPSGIGVQRPPVRPSAAGGQRPPVQPGKRPHQGHAQSAHTQQGQRPGAGNPRPGAQRPGQGMKPGPGGRSGGPSRGKK